MLNMTVIVTYVEVNGKSNAPTILEKEYQNFSDAFLPKVGDTIVVNDQRCCEDFEYKVIDIRVLINPILEGFDVLIEKTY